jgi:hypothetical protein
VEHEELINTLRKILRGCVINLEVKLGVQGATIKKPGPRNEHRSRDKDVNELELFDDFGSAQIDMTLVQSCRALH